MTASSGAPGSAGSARLAPLLTHEIGSLAKPNSAPAIVNLVYLPMGYLAGLWVPVQMLPTALRHVAPAFPAYHLGQLALGTLGAGEGVWWVHWLVLAAYAVGGFALAAVGLRRGEDQVYA